MLNCVMYHSPVLSKVLSVWPFITYYRITLNTTQLSEMMDGCCVLYVY